MAAISSIRVAVNNSKKLNAATGLLLRKEVLVGVPDTAAERKLEPGEKSALSNAVIGYLMEFGVPSKNIPARPFLIPGVESAEPKIIDQLSKAGKAALDGDASGVEKGLVAVGLVGQSAVQEKITDGPFVPLSNKTIAARARRGRAGALFEKQRRAQGLAPDNENAKPLIDTGQLHQAVTYVIRTKGGR